MLAGLHWRGLREWQSRQMQPLPSSCTAARPEASAFAAEPEQGERARQANHRGDLENLAAHTLLTSSNAWLPGEEANDSAFPAGLKYKTPDGVEHEPSLYDPDYLRQQSAGHRKSDDCATRLATTQHMKAVGIQRPTPVHWQA